MTTTVRVDAANHAVKVQALDDAGDGINIPSVLAVVDPNKTQEFHAHQTRILVISELTEEKMVSRTARSRGQPGGQVARVSEHRRRVKLRSRFVWGFEV